MVLVEMVVDRSKVEWCHLSRLKESGFHGSTLWSLLVAKVVKGTEASFKNLTKMLDDGLQADLDVAAEILGSIARTSPMRCACNVCDSNRSSYCEGCLRDHGWTCTHGSGWHMHNNQ